MFQVPYLFDRLQESSKGRDESGVENNAPGGIYCL